MSIEPKTHIDEFKALSPVALSLIITHVASMVKSTARFSRLPLWSIVGHVFSVGSTSAHELCRKANLDPGQSVKRNTRELKKV